MLKGNISLNKNAWDVKTIFTPHRKWFENKFAEHGGKIHVDDMKLLLAELKKNSKSCAIRSFSSVRDYSNLSYRRKPPYDEIERHELFTIS
jgi:hypothetical protein